MTRVPELASNEEIFTLDYARNDFLQSCADFVLVLVDHSEIEMTITIPDGIFYGVLDLLGF